MSSILVSITSFRLVLFVGQLWNSGNDPNFLVNVSHLHPLVFRNLQDECELLLDMVGLGLGPKQLPYRGPGPPPADWDGLSVAVWNVPRKATQQQIVAPWTSAVSPREGSSLESKQISPPYKCHPSQNVKTDIPPNLESSPY